MINATQLTKVYGTPPKQVTALAQIDLVVPERQKLALVGRSGSGKTTLLNLLAGLDQPTSGSLSVDGLQLAKLSREKLAGYRLKTVGVIFQSFQLLPQRTAFQNVELPLVIAGVSRLDRKALVQGMLEQVQLQDRMNHYPWQMSGGEQQRVAIARALANDAPLLLADEPTGNLDSRTAESIVRLLLDIVDQHGKTLVLITHDRELASQCADRIVEMSDGVLDETERVPAGVSNDDTLPQASGTQS